MNAFSQLNIKIEKRFTGKKIEIEEVLGIQLEVLDFKIEPSKFDKGNGKLLTLQINFEDVKRVIFTGSVILQDQCLKAKELNGFPFSTTIIKLKPKGFQFT